MMGLVKTGQVEKNLITLSNFCDSYNILLINYGYEISQTHLMGY